MNETPLKFSAWLRQRLEAAGMSAGELAERARVARSGVYHYLGDKRLPDRKAIERIIAALGIESKDVPEFPYKWVNGQIVGRCCEYGFMGEEHECAKQPGGSNKGFQNISPTC